MNNYYFTISNAKTRKFVVQCKQDEDFMGFMFGIAHRCRENNLWFMIEDEKLSAEFKHRTAGLGTKMFQHWIAENYPDCPSALKSYLSLYTVKHGVFTCLIKDPKRFSNGMTGAEKPIEGLKPSVSEMGTRLWVFKTDPIKAHPVQVVRCEGVIDGYLTETTLYMSIKTDFGKTSCCFMEMTA